MTNQNTQAQSATASPALYLPKAVDETDGWLNYADARRKGHSYYFGSTCSRNHQPPMRYLSNGKCVMCNRIKPDRKAERKPGFADESRYDDSNTAISREQAKIDGKIYFIGEPCYQGHEPIRYTSSGACVICNNTLKARRNSAAKVACSPVDQAEVAEKCETPENVPASDFKLETAKTTPPVSAFKIEPTNEKTNSTSVEHAEPPPKITVFARRKILDELESAYDLEKTTYRPGWDDVKIAAKLNTPRAWVTKIREEFFGEIKNPMDDFKEVVAEFERVRKETGQACLDLAELRKKLDGFVKDVENVMKLVAPRLSALEQKFEIAKTVVESGHASFNNLRARINEIERTTTGRR